MLAPHIADIGKAEKHYRRKLRKPYALALSLRADGIHAVVPVAVAYFGKPMRADAVKKPIESPQAMAIDILALVGWRHSLISFMLLRRERHGRKITHAHIKYRAVAGRRDIFGDGIRKPEHIIGATRAYSLVEQRKIAHAMPPMKHITLGKLMCRTADYLVFCLLGSLRQKRKRILKLIAKAPCAAHLIKGGSGIEAACPYLIGNPFVYTQIKECVAATELYHVPLLIMCHAAAKIAVRSVYREVEDGTFAMGECEADSRRRDIIRAEREPLAAGKCYAVCICRRAYMPADTDRDKESPRAVVRKSRKRNLAFALFIVYHAVRCAHIGRHGIVCHAVNRFAMPRLKRKLYSLHGKSAADADLNRVVYI